jgi:uncharacterized membrane protein YeaQ/YmgE (transglycosylase-associated protein family)
MKANRRFRADFLFLGVLAGLLASYFFGPKPGFIEWYTAAFKYEAIRSTILASVAVGGIIGFIADRFFEVQQRKSE